MPARPLAIPSLAVLLWLASDSFALVVQYSREEVGPSKEAPPPPPTNPEAAFRYSPLRCYWQESGFDGFGMTRDEVLAAFRGDVDQANAALATFAALPAGDKAVRIFPSPGSVRSMDGKASYPCDWDVRWANHHWHFPVDGQVASESHTAVMTLFVARADQLPNSDPQALRWIGELDDDRFRVRETAARALAGLGEAARPVLAEALGKRPSAEQRERIEGLLHLLKPINAYRLKLPKGIRVVSVDGLVRETETEWRSRDPVRTWHAISRLAESAEYSEEPLPLLVEALSDAREQVREQALGAFVRLGGRGKVALAKLEAAADGARDPGPRAALAKAVLAVGKGADDAGGKDPWRENRKLRAAINEYCREAADRP
jgi:hypothetical protein